MGELNPPFPPAHYPVVIIGSGPGGLQLSYCLSRLGVEHALLSADDTPGGMFRRYPIFERLITWTKPYAAYERGERAYEWYDWNSLLGDEPEHRALVAEAADGSRVYPARREMEAGLAAFVEQAGVRARYGCRWEATDFNEHVTLHTTDGDYTCAVAVLAVGMTEPWVPPIEGIEHARHYVETRPKVEYTGKTVLIIGKRNSGFEVADALLPVARRIILASPRPARVSVIARTTAAARAVYLQPYEEHLLGGGTVVLDASIDRIEPRESGFRVTLTGTTQPGTSTIDVDEVIAATGFSTPLADLPGHGLRRFSQERLPVQTPYWQGVGVDDIYFAGSATQGSVGLMKHGIPSSSAAVHGFRYNARVLAEHLARTRFGVDIPRPPVSDVVGRILDEAAMGPELWNQQSYLARVISLDPSPGARDEGVLPLTAFLDDHDGDAIAVTIEPDETGDIRPTVYRRQGGTTREVRLGVDALRDPRTDDNRALVEELLR